MPKMNEGLNQMLSHFSDEELTDEEIEGIETAMDAEQQEELGKALQTLFDERDEFSSRVDKALETVTKRMIALAAPKEEEEEEEEKPKGEKEVKKSHDWGFTLVPPKED